MQLKHLQRKVFVSFKSGHRYLLLILFSFFFSHSAFSKSHAKVGCFVVNESYFIEQPTLLNTPQIELPSDSATLLPLYKKGGFELLIGSAIIISPALVSPWVAAFKVVVRKGDGQEMVVRSALRESDKGTMHAHFSLDKGFENGTLTIECNSIES